MSLKKLGFYPSLFPATQILQKCYDISDKTGLKPRERLALPAAVIKKVILTYLICKVNGRVVSSRHLELLYSKAEGKSWFAT